VGCVSLLAVVGCSRPKQYRLGEAIPVGSYTLSISMTEMTHQLHQRQLVIFYRCNGAGWTSLSQSEREEFVSFLPVASVYIAGRWGERICTRGSGTSNNVQG